MFRPLARHRERPLDRDRDREDEEEEPRSARSRSRSRCFALFPRWELRRTTGFPLCAYEDDHRFVCTLAHWNSTNIRCCYTIVIDQHIVTDINCAYLIRVFLKFKVNVSFRQIQPMSFGFKQTNRQISRVFSLLWLRGRGEYLREKYPNIISTKITIMGVALTEPHLTTYQCW